MAPKSDASLHRQRLIAALAKVLEDQSLSELYTDDIVREAGVSKRTFYQCFPNKEACFLALYRENSARVLAVLREAALQPGITALERVRQGATAYLSFMQGQSALMKRLYMDILHLGAEGLQAKRDVLQQFVDALLQAYEIEREQIAGLPALAPELIWAMVAGINELILFKIEDGQVDRLTDLAGVSEQLFMGQVLLHVQPVE